MVLSWPRRLVRALGVADSLWCCRIRRVESVAPHLKEKKRKEKRRYQDDDPHQIDITHAWDGSPFLFAVYLLLLPTQSPYPLRRGAPRLTKRSSRDVHLSPLGLFSTPTLQLRPQPCFELGTLPEPRRPTLCRSLDTRRVCGSSAPPRRTHRRRAPASHADTRASPY